MAYPFNIHHVIPVAVFNDFRSQLTGLFGDTFLQDYNNRLPLLTDPTDIAKLEIIYNNNPNMVDTTNIGLSQHSGSHPAYNDYVTNMLDLYLNHPDFEGQPDKQRTAIIDFQNVLMDELKSGVDFLMTDGSNKELQIEKIEAYFEDKILLDENFKNNDERLKQAQDRVVNYDKLSAENPHVKLVTYAEECRHFNLGDFSYLIV